MSVEWVVLAGAIILIGAVANLWEPERRELPGNPVGHGGEQRGGGIPVWAILGFMAVVVFGFSNVLAWGLIAGAGWLAWRVISFVLSLPLWVIRKVRGAGRPLRASDALQAKGAGE